LETIKHVFLDSDWAEQVLLASPLTINLHHNHIPNVTDWFMNLITIADKDCLEQSFTAYGMPGIYWFFRGSNYLRKTQAS
jgi:hypothetical protein